MAKSTFRVKGPEIRKAILEYARKHLTNVGNCVCVGVARKAGTVDVWDLTEEEAEYVFIDVEFDAEAT